ncbi:PfkB family carbohydrate kinase [Alkalihalophilus lindianensis]|uniref:PfkB family carbohydrate kinase n=1 Tax=Alkalihalophilus lindianensis TaxID=1630542 RepID=UPI003014D43A
MRKEIFFTSVSLIDNPVKEATAQAFRIAEEKGAIISFDPNVRLPLWDHPETEKENIRRYFNRAHIVKVSEEELLLLTGVEEEQEAILTLFSGANKLVIVTKGSKGSSIYTAGSMFEVKVVKVDAQDTTGAGDAFVGGLWYFLQNESKRIDLEVFLSNVTKVVEMGQFAGKCGAITTTRRRAIPALPTLNEVK